MIVNENFYIISFYVIVVLDILMLGICAVLGTIIAYFTKRIEQLYKKLKELKKIK